MMAKGAMKDNNATPDNFPETDRCFMIIPRQKDHGGKSNKKVECHEVFSAEPTSPSFLSWAEASNNFDRFDHPNHVPGPGWYLLVVNLIIVKKRLTKMLIDRGNDLNILYVETLNMMGINHLYIQSIGALSHV